MSPYRKGPAGSAEKLHSQLVRMRANQICARCGIESLVLQCAHVIRRSRAATRVDERNAWALCPSCHYAVDNDTVEHAALIERTIGFELYEELKALNLNPRVWRASDWQEETRRLRGLINALKKENAA